MRAHITAIKALLAPLGYGVHYVDVPEAPDYPYVLLWGSSGIRSAESLTGDLDLTDRLGVTCVATTPEGVLSVRTKVRSVLDRGEPTVTGRYVELRLWDSQDTRADQDVTLPSTNRHPCYGVDLYRMSSVPA